MTRRVGQAIAALLAVGALAACSSGSDPEAVTTATVGTGPPPPPSTAPADPYAIPTTIDAAYVERTINKLAEVVGEADRIAMRERNAPPEVHDRINAVYDEAFAPVIVNALFEELAAGFQGIIDPPGNATFTVVELERADKACVVAIVKVDTTRTLKVPTPTTEDTVVLERLNRSRDVHQYNPTPWVISDHTPGLTSELEEGVCESS